MQQTLRNLLSLSIQASSATRTPQQAAKNANAAHTRLNRKQRATYLLAPLPHPHSFYLVKKDPSRTKSIHATTEASIYARQDHSLPLPPPKPKRVIGRRLPRLSATASTMPGSSTTQTCSTPHHTNPVSTSRSSTTTRPTCPTRY